MDFEEFEKRVEHRKLESVNVFCASLLAGLNEFGLLNQGVMDFAARGVGRKLADLANIKGLLDKQTNGTLAEKCKTIALKLNDMLKISKISVNEKDNKVSIGIQSDLCKYCPKGVGGAELEGTICPFPGLIEEFLNAFLDEKVKLVGIGTENKPLIKEGDYCTSYYEPKKQ